MAPFFTLPTELKRAIFSLLESPDLASIRRTNRQIGQEVEPVLHLRAIVKNLKARKHLSEQCRKFPSRALAIRYLRIDHYRYEGRYKEESDVGMLRSLPNLESLQVSSPEWEDLWSWEWCRWLEEARNPAITVSVNRLTNVSLHYWQETNTAFFDFDSCAALLEIPSLRNLALRNARIVDTLHLSDSIALHALNSLHVFNCDIGNAFLGPLLSARRVRRLKVVHNLWYDETGPSSLSPHLSNLTSMIAESRSAEALTHLSLLVDCEPGNVGPIDFSMLTGLVELELQAAAILAGARHSFPFDYDRNIEWLRPRLPAGLRHLCYEVDLSELLSACDMKLMKVFWERDTDVDDRLLRLQEVETILVGDALGESSDNLLERLSAAPQKGPVHFSFRHEETVGQKAPWWWACENGPLR